MKKTALILAAMMTVFAASCSAKTNNTPAAQPASQSAEQASQGDRTNGRDVVTKDTMFIEGVKAGMTVDEVKAVLGEASGDMEIDDMHILRYGSEEKETSLIFQPLTQLYGDEEKRLAMASIEDNSLKLINGITIGCTKDEVINAFCCDLEDNTPEDMKKNGEKLLYGSDAFDKLDKLDRAGKLSEANENYRFGFAMNESDTKGVIYADIDLQSTPMTYFLMVTFDDSDKTESVMMMMAEANLIDEIISQGASE